MNSGTKVTIYHGTSLVSPVPDCKILREVAECQFSRFEPDKTGQVRCRKETLRLHHRNIDGQLTVPTGLVRALADRLRLQGAEVCIVDRRTFRKSQLLPANSLKACDSDDVSRLRIIRDHPLGQIEVRQADEIYDWMALILENYPKAKTLIAVPSKSMAWSVREKIREAAPQLNVQLKKRDWPPKPPQCLIANYSAIVSCIAKDWDMVLLPDTSSITHAKLLAGMSRFLRDPYRLYSFVRRGQMMSPYEKLLLESISGPVIHYAGRPAVNMLWLPTPKSPKANHACRSLAWKREVYWQNDRRNEYVAGVANAFIHRNLKKLRKLGVPFSGNEPNVPNWHDLVIAIVVESVEHGQELLKRLPDWALHRQTRSGEKIKYEKRAVGTITTTTRAAIDGIHADVVIQAAGGGGIGQFENTVIDELGEQNQPSALIVEFTDKHCDMAAQDATRRSREYKKFGWQQLDR